MKKVLFSGLLALSIVAAGHVNAMGANSDKKLIKEAAFQAGQMTTEGTTLLEVRRSSTTVVWRAQTPAGIFLCKADDMMRNPRCIKQEEVKTASAN
ncbi:MAG: hypothetical protein AAB883_01680 [Patescibacteria group bacterium]